MIICLGLGANDLHNGPVDATGAPAALAPLKSRLV